LIPRNNGTYSEKVKNITDKKLIKWINAVKNAKLKEIKIDYVVQQSKVIIVDLDTGRLQIGSRWSNGIHEMVEVKESVIAKSESGTIASISHPSFFDFYKILNGITGTAGEIQERDEVRNVYGIDTFDVPPHRPCLRKRLPTCILKSKDTKLNAIVKATKLILKTRPILILMSDIRTSNMMSDLLKKNGIHHLVLNEEQQESEELIVYKAGQIGNVTVATNTAGRGTDIKITKAALESGGLHVIFGAFPSNLRVECQGLGRSARQGQPGSNEIFISMDEKLVQELITSQNINISIPEFDLNGKSISLEAEMSFVEALYNARTKLIISVSEQRCHTTALERIRFVSLQYFFNDQEWLIHKGLVSRNICCQQAYEDTKIYILQLQENYN